DNDVGETIAVDVAGGHVNAAGEEGCQAVEITQRPSHRLEGPAVVDTNLRSATRPGADDDVRNTITIHVGNGGAHAAVEEDRVGIKGRQHGVRANIEHADLGRTGVGTDDDQGRGVHNRRRADGHGAHHDEAAAAVILNTDRDLVDPRQGVGV